MDFFIEKYLNIDDIFLYWYMKNSINIYVRFIWKHIIDHIVYKLIYHVKRVNFQTCERLRIVRTITLYC